MSDSFVVRRASLADHAALVTLEERCQPRPWSPAQLLEELQHSMAEIFVAEEENGLLAMTAVRLIVDELWILQVGTAPNARRKGLARELLQVALSASIATEATHAWLEVRASNAGAIALYRSLGFQERGRRRGYYPPVTVVDPAGKEVDPKGKEVDPKGKKKGPREDAVLFSLELPAG